MEIWKDIPEYDGHYQVSNLGNLKSLDRIRSNGKGQYMQKGRILKCSISSNRYLVVVLQKKTPKTFLVHRLVATCFKDNPDKLPQVNHIDGNKLNNRADNLEWCTLQQNMDHANANGLMHKHKGSTHHFSKLSKDDVLNIRFNRHEFNTPYYIIAEFYGVSKQAVMDIIKGKNWAHL